MEKGFQYIKMDGIWKTTNNETIFSNKMIWFVQRNRRKEINGRKWKNGIQWIKVDLIWKALIKSIEFRWSIFGQSPKIDQPYVTGKEKK